MADRPILFSAPMVRALLAGTKTQTRRIVAGVPERPFANCHPHNIPRHGSPYLDSYCSERKTPANPRGMSTEWCWWQVDDRPCLSFKVKHKPGDRLWVRERLECANGEAIGYPADGTWFPNDHWRWTRQSLPSIHMPRAYSRLTLTVTDVRVQRLQDITLGDICAEGLARSIYDFKPVQRGFDAWTELWEQINGAGSWDANPWVAAYTFTVERQNIDTEVPHDL